MQVATTGTGSRVRPVDFIGLSHFHVAAVLPVISTSELGVFSIIAGTLVSLTDSTINFFNLWTVAALIVLSHGHVLSTQVPVDVHGTHTILPVRSSDRDVVNKHVSIVSLGDIGTGLRTNIGQGINNTLNIWQVRLLAGADILSTGDGRRKIIRNIVRCGSITNVNGARGRTRSRSSVDNDGGCRSPRIASKWM